MASLPCLFPLLGISGLVLAMNGSKRRETALVLDRCLLLLLGLQLHRGRGLLTVAIFVHVALRRQIRLAVGAPPQLLLEIHLHFPMRDQDLSSPAATNQSRCPAELQT